MKPAALALFVLSVWGCDPRPTSTTAESAELDGVRVAQAIDSLMPHLGPEPSLLELRANGAGVTLQVVRAETAPPQVVEFHYPFATDGGPDGSVEGPREVPLRGTGETQENAFPLGELDLAKITAAFSVARRAVDPADGRVRELIVRRMLPFHRSIRARIYVDSPRMSGSIDTNAGGTPLKL